MKPANGYGVFSGLGLPLWTFATCVVLGCSAFQPASETVAGPLAGGDRLELARRASFTLHVVAQRHPCPFHPTTRDDLFGPLPGHGCKIRVLGSGFLIDDDGFSLTNHHVVEDGVLIEADFGDGKRRPVELRGSDPDTDIALVRVLDAPRVPCAPLGSTRNLRVGDPVSAIGSPLGLGGTLAQGIVTYLGRTFPGEVDVPFIQTNAGLHPGNSGGALLDSEGRVVGVTSAIVHSEGLGFAIPIDLALDIVRSLRAAGHVVRGSIGVETQPLEADLAQALGLPISIGALITDVRDGGPAAAAGLRPRDVLIALGGDDVPSDGTDRAIIARLRPGLDVVARVANAKGARDVAIAVVPRERMKAASHSNLTSPLGMSVGETVDARPGAVILDVEPGGAAERAKLEPGDVIVETDGRIVATLEDFKSASEPFLRGHHALLLQVRRRTRHLFAVIKPES